MSPVPDSDRPEVKFGPALQNLQAKANDIRDEEIAELQKRVDRLKQRVEELERRPVCVPMPSYPMPSYPVDCPHRWPRVPDWTYQPQQAPVTWSTNTSTTSG